MIPAHRYFFVCVLLFGFVLFCFFILFGVVCVRIKYFLQTEYGHYEANCFVLNYGNDDNSKVWSGFVMFGVEALIHFSDLEVLDTPIKRSFWTQRMNFTECYEHTVSSVAAAARTGSWKQVRRLIKRGFSADCRDNRGWNALHEAAAAGSQECVKEMLSSVSGENSYLYLVGLNSRKMWWQCKRKFKIWD